MVCPECRGTPAAPGGKVCSACRGKGRIAKECSIDGLITPSMQGFLDTYHFWSAHGVLPQAGGLLDQPATWVRAVRIVDSEVALITEEQMEERRKEAERSAKRNR